MIGLIDLQLVSVISFLIALSKTDTIISCDSWDVGTSSPNQCLLGYSIFINYQVFLEINSAHFLIAFFSVPKSPVTVI